jgi:CheY-like chemotaxis protein
MIRVLIVEDELLEARDMEGMLTSFGCKVLGIAATAEEAIALAGRLSPNLIFMDIRIKGSLDGIEAAGRIRELYGSPVVYVSALADEATLRRAKSTKPLGYLFKPFAETELRAALKLAAPS